VRRAPILILGLLLVGLLLVRGLGGPQPLAAGATTCGEERWPVKTLSDPRERLVNYKPHDSSIGRLRKKPHPHVGPNTKRIEGVETTNYRVAARLVEMKLADDRDINLVIAVPSAPAKTMIVEFPDPTCNGASSSPKRGKMASARSAIIAACGQPSSSHFTDRSGKANITGVGFFDIPHGQTGIAPNAIRAASGPEVLGVELFALARTLPKGAIGSAALHGKQRFRATTSQLLHSGD
jgi:hypothetical protein